MDNGAEGDAGGAFGEPGLGVVVPGGAGDVEMDPGRVAGEFTDKPRAGDRAAAFAAADVLNVGEAALDEFAILIVHREFPHFFPDSFGARKKLVGPGTVGAEDTDVDVGEGHHNRSGERGGVDEVRGAELFRVVHAVGEDEAAFGVGVEHFDRFAGHGGLDVAGFLGFAAGHVFGGGNDADYFYGRLQRGDSTHDADHGGAAGHVVLHFFHALGRLDRDAARVEGDCLADQANHWGPGLGIRRR